jgi:hypothetical protein
MTQSVRGLLLLLALTQVVLQVRGLGPENGRIGLDFYQYWVVGKVVSLSDGAVRNPYTQQPLFSKMATEHAQGTSEPALGAVASLRPDLELQATPFAYTFFSIYPGHYTASLRLHQIAQICAFVLAIFLLLRNEAALDRLLVACVAMPVFGPLASDLSVANFNCFLLLFLALTFRLAQVAFAREGTSSGGKLVFAAGALTLAAAAALLKPSLMFVAPLLALAIYLRMRTVGLGAIAMGGVGSVALAALPVWYFDSVEIWLQWKHYFDNGNVDMYSLPFAMGNLSLPGFIARTTGLPLVVSALVLVAGLLVAGLCAVQVTHGNGPSRLHGLLLEPASVVSVAVLLFFAISPLAWLHYHLLLLVPALLLAGDGSRAGMGAMAVVLLLSTNVLSMTMGLFVPAQPAQTAGFYGTMLAWPLLWFLMLFAWPKREAQAT